MKRLIYSTPLKLIRRLDKQDSIYKKFDGHLSFKYHDDMATVAIIAARFRMCEIISAFSSSEQYKFT